MVVSSWSNFADTVFAVMRISSLVKNHLDKSTGHATTVPTPENEEVAQDSRAYFLRGGTKSRLGDHAGAEADFTLALQHGSDDPLSYLLRGLSRYQQKNWNGAEHDFSEAIGKGLADAGIYLMRGMARLEQRNQEGAKSDFRQGVAAPEQSRRSKLLLRLFAAWILFRHRFRFSMP
jgi:hypothetical protein